MIIRYSLKNWRIHREVWLKPVSIDGKYTVSTKELILISSHPISFWLYLLEQFRRK